MVLSKLVWIVLILQLGQNASQKESERHFGYNHGPQHGCNAVGRKINVYNFYCGGKKGGIFGDNPTNQNDNVQADEQPQPPVSVVRPVIYTPYRPRPIANLLLPFRRFRPIRYSDLPRPISRPFQYQDQGSSVVSLSGAGSPTRIQYVRPQGAYPSQAVYNRPQSAPQTSSSNSDNVYNPFRPESSTNVKPTPPSSNPSQNNNPDPFDPNNRPSSVDNVYNPFRPESSQSNRPSSVDNVYNPFRPESSQSNRPSSVDNVYNPFRPESSQNMRPTNNNPDNVYNPFGSNSRPPPSSVDNVRPPQTPSPLTVDYFGTPIPTFPPIDETTTQRPNYAVPAYPINLPTNRPFSPSSISNSYFTSSVNRPGLTQASAGISSIGNRPGFSQISASSGINSFGNRPGSGFTQVTGLNRPGSDNFNRPTNDHRPVNEDYDDDVDAPDYKPFGSNLIGGVTSSVNGFLQNFSGQTLIPGRSLLTSFFDLF